MVDVHLVPDVLVTPVSNRSLWTCRETFHYCYARFQFAAML